MEKVRKIKLSSTLITGLLSLACAALPWIGLIPATTYLLIGCGATLVFTGGLSKLKPVAFRDPLLILFILYYLLQLAGFAAFPGDSLNRFSLEQKASLLFVPLLLTVCFELYPESWTRSLKGFLTGISAACAFCLLTATGTWLTDGSTQTFFYHPFAATIGANAIYLSLYILTAICLIVYHTGVEELGIRTPFRILLLVILYGSLLLLSSKTAIAIGTVLIAAALLQTKHGNRFRKLAALIPLSTVLVLAVTDNPIRNRYLALKPDTVTRVLAANNFEHYVFNGLDLRLLLWRMGGELLNEHKAWSTGMGGRRYHGPLNEKMKSYLLFEGNEVTKDTGYLNYDLHNQYAENLVQFGIPGVLLLLAILLTAMSGAVRWRDPFLKALVLVFFVSFMTESALETQSGILLFTIFIYGAWRYRRSLPSTSAYGHHENKAYGQAR